MLSRPFYEIIVVFSLSSIITLFLYLAFRSPFFWSFISLSLALDCVLLLMVFVVRKDFHEPPSWLHIHRFVHDTEHYDSLTKATCRCGAERVLQDGVEL